ncbi:MAG: N-acetylmuramoyl-L-alanine amidase [Actinophytocola sp.]|uniref:peptidoglycan recognition protein family protein n=1 Tax=Actinophytocola sp. TaxID=1872138 RepID=UPI003C711C03
MSVTQCLEVNARLRAAGITVREAAGWQTRGNGQVSAYEGGLIHHTATGYGVALPGTGVGNLLINGRPDLDGPLCNYAGNDDGSITVIAAHPANHAGASGGRSMGPLPVTKLFNRRVMGLEIVYPGTVPMRDAQYRSALVWAKAVADVVGRGDLERVRGHAETSITGKWDPGNAPNRTIDMTAFRAAAKNGALDDMTPEQARILGDLHEALISGHDWTTQHSKSQVYKVLGDVVTRAVAAGHEAGAKADAVGAKVEGLKAGIDEAVQRGISDYLTANPPTVKVELDYTLLAKAVNDDADARARDNNPATGPRS